MIVFFYVNKHFNKKIYDDRSDVIIMKILVIGSCASTKRKIPCTARELYMGRQHLLTCQAIDKLREQYEVDFYILSALRSEERRVGKECS